MKMPHGRLLEWLREQFARNAGVIAFGAVLAGSLALNVVLGLRQTEPSTQIVRSGGVQAGDTIPPVPVTTSGAVRPLQFARKTVLYVFSPTCDWCKRDYPNLMAIHAAAQGRFDFVGVTMNTRQLPEYLAQHPFPGPVASVAEAALPPEFAKDLKVTPQLLVVDEGGLVQRAWVGALMEMRRKEAEDFFGVALPDTKTAVRQQALLTDRR